MKQLGIISIVMTWVGLIFLIRKWKGNASLTFSQHAARYKSSKIYYFGLFIVTMPTFSLFMYRWFIPEYKLGVTFGYLLGVGILGQVIAAVIPETVGRKVTIHRFAAFLSATSMIPMAVILALDTKLPSLVRVVIIALVTYQSLGMLILAKYKGYHPKVLYAQASYVASFHLAILAVTYLR